MSESIRIAVLFEFSILPPSLPVFPPFLLLGLPDTTHAFGESDQISFAHGHRLPTGGCHGYFALEDITEEGGREGGRE